MDPIPNSASMNRRDHRGMPIDAVVAVTELDLSFSTILRLAIFITVAQAIIGIVIAVALVALDVI